MKSQQNRPLVSVVIPSFNQAKFLGNAVESVLSQNYGRVELIVMDGGSSDDSVDVIKSFENKLAYWISKPDGGQAMAINEGFRHSHGEILCWLNSDDYFLPGALAKVVDFLNPEEKSLLFGNCIHVNEESSRIHGSNVVGAYSGEKLSIYDYIVQPSSFWTRATWEHVGPLDENLHYTLDWDWFQKAYQCGIKFNPINDYLSAYRIHPEHKTGTGGKDRVAEVDAFLKKWNSPELYDAILKYREKRNSIQHLSGLLVRFRMRKLRPRLLKALYPDIFSHLSLGEAELSYHTIA